MNGREGGGQLVPIPRAQYVRRLAPLLPREAFAREPRQLWGAVVHLVMVGGGWAVAREADGIGVMALAALLTGHSVGCLLFVAHDLSHGSILRPGRARSLCELLFWGINLIPPTLWRCLHNRTHHRATNTVQDTDRAYRAVESTPAVRLYIRFFFPSRVTLRWNPFVLAHFVTYIARHLVAALLPARARPSIVTFRPAYTAAQRRAIVLELAAIAAMQVGVFHATGGEWGRYVFGMVLPLFVASSVAMLYVWTNHLLQPLRVEVDPLLASTSVIVPGWMNLLHDHFAFHSEHHVFPAMHPRHYPRVSELLAQHFPERYRRLPLADAWRQLWRKGAFIDE